MFTAFGQKIKHTRKNHVFGLCPLCNVFLKAQRLGNWICFQTFGRWTKSKSMVLSSATHHRQNPLEFICYQITEERNTQRNVTSKLF